MKYNIVYSIFANVLKNNLLNPNLLNSNAKFCFGEEEKRAFNYLKDVLCNKLVIQLYKINTVIDVNRCRHIDNVNCYHAMKRSKRMMKMMHFIMRAAKLLS